MSQDIEAESSLVRECGIDPSLEYANQNLTPFGNSFLDDALDGLLPNDLCLLGARSGIGKTQLATSIAASNAIRKKNVVYVALEAEQNEIEMRLRFSIEAGLYFRDQMRDRTAVISYRRWRLGYLQAVLKKYKEEAITIFIQRYATLHTIYRTESYGIREFEKTLTAARDYGDLFVVDHLQYFDLDSATNEVSQVSQIIKRIRALNLFYNKPFIVVSHLRKNIEGLVPDIEDFHGSSDIGKNCTIAIMLTKDPQGYDVKNQLQKTIVSIPKARTGGYGNLVGCIDYSITHQQYFPHYTLARASKLNDKIESIQDDQIPQWATSCKTKAPLNK